MQCDVTCVWVWVGGWGFPSPPLTAACCSPPACRPCCRLPACLPADPAARKAFLKELHEQKTDLFNQLIETGSLPVRPGVKRLISEAIDLVGGCALAVMGAGSSVHCRRCSFWCCRFCCSLPLLLPLVTINHPSHPPICRLLSTTPPAADEAIDAGVQVAVCSTSNERAVSNIVKVGGVGDRCSCWVTGISAVHPHERPRAPAGQLVAPPSHSLVNPTSKLLSPLRRRPPCALLPALRR